jgi:hypothetical protein
MVEYKNMPSFGRFVSSRCLLELLGDGRDIFTLKTCAENLVPCALEKIGTDHILFPIRNLKR